MATRDFVLPDLGEGLTEGQVVGWRVDVGDAVVVDQPLADIETAKATVELPSPFAGTVTARHAAVGEEVAVGEPLVTIEVAAADAPVEPPRASAGSARAGSGDVDQPGEGLLVGYGAADEHAGATGGHGSSGDGRVGPAPGEPAAPAQDRAGQRPLAKPPVRKRAKDLGVDLAEVPASGPGGVVTREDVEAFARAGSADSGEDERIPLRGVRKAIAQRMATAGREVPQAFANLECDATELVELARELDAAHQQVKVTPLAVLTRACVAGLSRFGELNAHFDAEAEEIVRKPTVNLGFAAHTDRGLLVPVIRQADRLSTVALAEEIARLATAAREDTVTPHELTGGTFTVSNYGAVGIDHGSPLVNHPEVAVLGIGRIAQRPWVVDDELAVRKVMTLTLGFDHRVCDGAEAAGFLRFLGGCVERPATLLAAL